MDAPYSDTVALPVSNSSVSSECIAGDLRDAAYADATVGVCDPPPPPDCRRGQLTSAPPPSCASKPPPKKSPCEPEGISGRRGGPYPATTGMAAPVGGSGVWAGSEGDRLGEAMDAGVEPLERVDSG